MPTEKVISLNNLDRYDKNLKTVAGILQRSTAYALGDVVHNKNIYLKCTTAGTTKATTLDLTSAVKDDTVTDGTVVWTVTSTTGPASGESSGAGLEDWKANHNYAIDDIYVYEGEIYKTLVKFTSGATEDSRTKINDIVPSVWTANTEYTAGDIIEHTDVTTSKKVYYNVTSNFTSGATFEVIAEMQELQIVEAYVPQELTSTDVAELINAFNPSGGGSQGGGNNYKQVLLYDITAPYDSELGIATTEDFCLPPVEVLKFQTTEQDVTKNIFSFEVQDGSSFVIDGVSADKNHFVAFDGKVHLNTSYEIAFGEPTDIGDYDICESEAIKISDYKSIGGLV